MTIRTLFIAAALMLTAFVPVARAQNGMPPALQAEISAFQKSLKLTPDQQKKLEALNKKYAPKMQAIFTKYGPERDKMMKSKATREQQMALMKKISDEMKPLNEAQRKESEAIFTPEQRTKIKAFQAKMMSKMKQGAGAPK